eukprot:6962749-Alexandrium_andersonii.AAC.1
MCIRDSLCASASCHAPRDEIYRRGSLRVDRAGKGNQYAWALIADCEAADIPVAGAVGGDANVQVDPGVAQL